MLKAQADRLNKLLISGPAVLQKEKNSFIKEESNKLLHNKESRVDAFIKGLGSKQQIPFFITKPSTMEEVERTVIHITREGQCIHTSNKKYKSDSTSGSCSESGLYSDSPNNDSDSSIEKGFIKMKSSSHSKKKHAGISQKDKVLVLAMRL